MKFGWLMPQQQLSRSARPRTLDALVGQAKVVKRVRGHIKAGRDINGWLFTGPTGTGKTTIARILALSLQCTHQKEFGSPCDECRENKTSFDIYEVNGAKIRGKQQIEEELSGADYSPRIGQYRVYILDECHKMTDEAQNLILKYIEDAVETTIYILCSTAPHKIIETLQGRCVMYQLRQLELEDITVLVTRLLKRAKSELPADRLADSLVDRGVFYPRLICHAVEKYIAGADPDEAAEVQGSTMVDTKALCRALVKGDWAGVTKYLSQAQTADVRAIRLGCLAYLRSILWNETEIAERTSAVAKAITELCQLGNSEDMVMSAGLSASLYRVASVFSRYNH